MEKTIMRLLALPLVFMMATSPAMADEAGFNQWLQNYNQRAPFSQDFLSSALGQVEYKPRVIELDQKQPEHKITFARYKKNVITQSRIDEGRRKLAENFTLLSRISKTYGVPAQYIVALWGIETSYGKVTGGFDTLSALATLSYEGRRADFFERELTAALKILQGGHAGTGKLTGSWAGAMGQCQFMPTSYHKYAVDGDGDGNIDIWNSKADIFASIANYLRTEGWNDDIRWGRAVSVPSHIPETHYGRENMRPLSYWRSRGVRLPSGAELPMPSDGTVPMAALVAPDGAGNQPYLVYGNYNIIMHWNKSTYFATSVGLLADALALAR